MKINIDALKGTCKELPIEPAVNKKRGKKGIKATPTQLLTHQSISGSLHLKARLDKVDRTIREMNIKLQKCELREQQLMIMFKMLLDKALGHAARGVTMKQIASYMKDMITSNPEVEISHEPEDIDLVSEIIKHSEMKP